VNQLEGEQRMAAHVEEVVVDIRRFDAENSRPHAGDHRFQRCSRRSGDRRGARWAAAAADLLQRMGVDLSMRR
jgi:hypothetical protein